MDTKFIAELGSNINQSFERGKQLIDSAKKLGFWAIKMQAFKAEKLTLNPEKIEQYKKQETPIELIIELCKYCKSINMQVGCSVFYLEAVDILKEYVDFFKISSFDILRKNLIKKCLDTEKQLFISCGLIDENYDIYPFNNSNDITLLHCISKYPATINELYLYRIKRFKMQAYSDHSVSIPAIIQAIKNGSEYIELHFDLNDMQGNESHYGHVWNESKIKELFNFINDMEIANSGEFEVTKEMKELLADPITGLRK